MKIDGWFVEKHANLWENPEPLEIGCSFSCSLPQNSGQSTGTERGNELLKKNILFHLHKTITKIIFISFLLTNIYKRIQTSEQFRAHRAGTTAQLIAFTVRSVNPNEATPPAKKPDTVAGTAPNSRGLAKKRLLQNSNISRLAQNLHQGLKWIFRWRGRRSLHPKDRAGFTYTATTIDSPPPRREKP